MMSDREFWTQVRRRRNQFFWAWLGWLPFGVICTWFYYVIAKREPPVYFGLGLLVVWSIVWSRVGNRLIKLPCPRCGGAAMAHPYFFLQHAKCQHCDFAYKDA